MTREQLQEILRRHKLWLDGAPEGRRANLSDANLNGAYLRDADLSGADLSDANLLCFGNMREICTMQFGKWNIGYTAEILQIGCQRHSIEKWQSAWESGVAGRKWIDQMDDQALEWADRNMALVLSIIASNPATPTGYEVAATY